MLPFLHTLIIMLFNTLNMPAISSAMDTISAGQVLPIGDKLISKNGRYALGFFEADSEFSQSTSTWYLGIWFNTHPPFTQLWVANRDSPIKNPTSLSLKFSHDGNLNILDQSTNSVFWSTKANIVGNGTMAILLNSGNFVLANASDYSNILWQSFDHPTDSFFPGAKLGWDKVTGVNRRLVSQKNSINPASGIYCYELDLNRRLVLRPLNSSTPYWFGRWNGHFFGTESWMDTKLLHNLTLFENDQQTYITYGLFDETLDLHHVLGVSGQVKSYIWHEPIQDWVLFYNTPKNRCDVPAVCGPFTICNDDIFSYCTCIKGFTIKSLGDWVLNDRTGGCLRNTPLSCTTDKFYPVTCVSLPQSAEKIESAKGIVECTQACLSNCSCTAYSFRDDVCYIWHEELLGIRQVKCGVTMNSSVEGTLYIRLAAAENKRGFVIRLATSASVVALGLFAFIMFIMVWRRKRKNCGSLSNTAQGGTGIIAFQYIDLQRATNNFSEKIGGGGFGSVFKGLLNGSTSIAVKRLDHANQGEKQFRAEVSTIGIIQHINLVKLIGFCSQGARRLLVYEHMPRHSLDIHLFKSRTAVLKWSTRYQIALGVAKGLAYLHQSCRDCIIHCDIKPENILLDDSFIPKIADFGMAKLLGRDFSQVLTTMRGTIGYLAPEWINGVAVTPKVDVYAYGMVLLEIISGRRNSCVSCSCSTSHDVYYPVHVAQKIVEGDIGSLLDHRLHDDVNLKEVEIACKVAGWCIQDNELDRPTMGNVVQILEGLLEINIPPVPRLLQAIAGSSHSNCF
ncbi:hypothetical protein ACP4OV_001649 [Aristida adscensionis]